MALLPSRINGPHSKSSAIKQSALGLPSRSPYNASCTTKHIQTSPCHLAKAAASAVINIHWWKEGRMEFRKKDVIKLRAEWDRKSKKKIEMRKWVLSRIVDKVGKGMVEIDDDED